MEKQKIRKGMQRFVCICSAFIMAFLFALTDVEEVKAFYIETSENQCSLQSVTFEVDGEEYVCDGSLRYIPVDQNMEWKEICKKIKITDYKVLMDDSCSHVEGHDSITAGLSWWDSAAKKYKLLPFCVYEDDGKEEKNTYLEIEEVPDSPYYFVDFCLDGDEGVYIKIIFRRTCPISYELNGGSFPEGVDVPETCAVFREQSLVSPVKSGSQFLGWTIKDQDNSGYIDYYEWNGRDAAPTFVANWDDTSAPVEISNADITLEEEKFAFEEGGVRPEPDVKLGDKDLQEGTDYFLSYRNNDKAATADSDNPPTVIITGIGKYTGTVEKKFTITKRDLYLPYDWDKWDSCLNLNIVKGKSLSSIDLSDAQAFAYENEQQYYYGGGEVKGTFSWENKDYVPQAEVGTVLSNDSANDSANGATTYYNLIFTPDNQDGYNVTTFSTGVYITVKQGNIADCSVTFKSGQQNYTYTGEAIKPEVIVKDGDVTLVEGTHYTVSYAGYINAAGSTDTYAPTVTIKGIGDYFGTQTLTYTIAPKVLTNENTTIELGTALTYTGAEQTQTVSSVTCNGLPVTYTVSNNTGTDARDDYELTVTGTGNFTGTATQDFSIGKKSVTGINQTLLVKTGSAKNITYDLSKLLTEGVTGTTTYAVGTVTNENGVLSAAPTTADISADGKLTLKVANVATVDQTATVKITFTNANYEISEATLTIQTTEKTLVTLSGVTCGNRVYNGTAYAYTGTPVWTTEDGTPVTSETNVTNVAYYEVANLKEQVDAPINAGSYLAVFTITSDEYVGTESYSFEITKAEITVAAKNKSIYIGDAVPSLENPTAGTDYTVTGLCGTDALGGTAAMSYAQEPDNTKTGTYEILISGLTVPEGDNYTITFTNGTLTITTKPSGGSNSSGGAAGGVTDQPENSDNTTTITNEDGSTTTTTTETDANGNTVTTTTTVATDGSTTEKVQATDTNAAGKEVAVTTTTKTDADGNVTSVTEKSVIDNIAKDTTATVTVKTDGDGNVTSAKASVTKTSDTGTVSLGSKVLGQITEAAGADTKVRVTMTVKDSEGNTKYKVQADADEIIPGETLYIYKLDTKTGKYTMVNAKEYKVTKAGTVTVNMTKKATYELVTAQESKAITKEILATVKPAKSSKSLSEDKKTTFKLSEKLDMDNVKSITYATSEKSIATISKKGTITAVNAGTATVKATVTLKNGTKKTVKMTIKVK